MRTNRLLVLGVATLLFFPTANIADNPPSGYDAAEHLRQSAMPGYSCSRHSDHSSIDQSAQLAFLCIRIENGIVDNDTARMVMYFADKEPTIRFVEFGYYSTTGKRNG